MVDEYAKYMFDSFQNWYKGFFGVADYEFDVKNSKNKMVDPIWQTGYLKSYLILILIEIRGILRSLNTNEKSKLIKYISWKT